ncbi:MAG: hypothetical protein GF308_12125 [Candidatus Heimdallarchaeota archaeon]|nr:hypothetical protein [Candidatus Heimdallarchaeota archaeon]
MSKELPEAKIPGTLYSLQFGTDGNYYAVFLVRGRQNVATKRLDIVRGTSLRDLPEEIENALRTLLDREQIFLSPAIVDRVVNEIVTQIPEKGKVTFTRASQTKRPSGRVKQLIQESEERVKRQAPASSRQPIDTRAPSASAEDIGKIPLKKPRPISETVLAREDRSASIKSTAPKDQSSDVLNKVDRLTNELAALQNLADQNKKEIETLKKELSSLKEQKKVQPVTSKEIKISYKDRTYTFETDITEDELKSKRGIPRKVKEELAEKLGYEL